MEFEERNEKKMKKKEKKIEKLQKEVKKDKKEEKELKIEERKVEISIENVKNEVNFEFEDNEEEDEDEDDGDDAYYYLNDDYTLSQYQGISSTSSSSSSFSLKQLENKINLSIKVSNEIIKSEKKSEKRLNYYGKDDRATSEQVLDPRTRMILFKLLNNSFLSEINGCLSTGKEANVYYAKGGGGNNLQEYAIKIFKTSILVFKDRDRLLSLSLSIFFFSLFLSLSFTLSFSLLDMSQVNIVFVMVIVNQTLVKWYVLGLKKK